MPLSLLNRLQRHYTISNESGCWLWHGAKSSNGYGIIRINDHTKRAHRVMFELIKLQIPNKFELDHLCRVRNCINPDHLEVVTHRENVLRGEGLAAQHIKRDKCLYGHLLLQGKLRRLCKICKRQATRRYYYRSKSNKIPIVAE